MHAHQNGRGKGLVIRDALQNQRHLSLTPLVVKLVATPLKKKREPCRTLHDASSRVRSGEPRLFPLQCWVYHGLASGNAFSSVSLFNTVMVLSVGFSGVLALAFMFDAWPRPCTHRKVPLRTQLCFFSDVYAKCRRCRSFWWSRCHEILSDEISMMPFLALIGPCCSWFGIFQCGVTGVCFGTTTACGSRRGTSLHAFQPGNQRVVQHGANAVPLPTHRTGCTWYAHN